MNADRTLTFLGDLEKVQDLMDADDTDPALLAQYPDVPTFKRFFYPVKWSCLLTNTRRLLLVVTVVLFLLLLLLARLLSLLVVAMLLLLLLLLLGHRGEGGGGELLIVHDGLCLLGRLLLVLLGRLVVVLVIALNIYIRHASPRTPSP